MADHSKPLITSSYANFVSELDGRFDDLTLGLDPAVTSPTNLPTGAIRWNSASYKWEKWSGSAWSDLSAYYNINLAGPLTLTANSSSDALRITQTGAGNALVVEDSANPDSTPFVVSGTGDVGVGKTSPAYKLDVVGTASVSSNMLVGGTLGVTGVTTFSSNPVYSAGTANGVVYLNGSKVATTGSALTFDGSLFSNEKTQNYQYRALFNSTNYCDFGYFGTNTVAPSNPFRSWYLNGSEQMRLTSTGLGIGTSSPGYKLDVSGQTRFNAGSGQFNIIQATSGYQSGLQFYRPGYNNWYVGSPDASTSLVIGESIASPALTIATGGNLGLGVTPSAWTTLKGLQITSGSLAGYAGAATNNQVHLLNNAYYGASGWTYVASDTAQRYTTVNGQHQWWNAPSGTAGSAITFTQAMTLDASGRLGIGQTSPAALLHLKGSSPAIFVEDTGANRALLGITASNTEVTFDATAYTSAVQAMVFKTGNSERMRIDSSGNVGIGTTTMSGKLNVIGGPTYWGYTAAQGYLSYSSGEPVIGAVSGQGLRIYTNNTEAMRIDSSGNVGIGTSSPSDKLDIASGNIRLTTGQNLRWVDSGNIRGALAVDGSSNLLAYTAGSERMRIDSSGVITSGLGGMQVISGTSVSASGTSVTFSGIPSWVKRITVMFNGVSTSGTSNPLVRLGTSGGVVSSGYISAVLSGTGTADTTGFIFANAITAATLVYGQMTICNVSGNSWTETTGIIRSGTGTPTSGAGGVTLSGTLTQIRITTVNGTDTFDAGSINILYE